MRTHTGERPHKCEVCGKTFVQSGQLVIHTRAHTGEKPYSCEFCSKGFTCSKQLKVHLRTHTDEKPYKCDECGKTFGYNHVLKMHKMSHLGEKLYKCTLCDNFFSSRKALDTHIREHDNNGSDNGKPKRKPKLPRGKPGRPSKAEKARQLSMLQNENENKAVPNSQNENMADNTFRDCTRGSYNNMSHIPDEPTSSSPKFEEFESRFPGYVSDDSGRGSSPIYDTASPSRSPDSFRYSMTSLPDSVEDSLSTYETLSNSPVTRTDDAPFDLSYNKQQTDNIKDSNSCSFLSQPKMSQKGIKHGYAFLTTDDGEKVACPLDFVLKLKEGKHNPEDYHVQLQQEVAHRLRMEITKKQREDNFISSVRKVLESLLEPEILQRFGYPHLSVDEILINTLQVMNTQPCFEPSLAPMDRIKVNLRLLLEGCVTDQSLWIKFGWRGKSIEDIITEFLQHC